jgi:hypothetical protein
MSLITEFEAYKAGAIARKAGVVVGDNPHNEHTEEYWRWMQGWLDGAKPQIEKEKTNG